MLLATAFPPEPVVPVPGGTSLADYLPAATSLPTTAAAVHELGRAAQPEANRPAPPLGTITDWDDFGSTKESPTPNEPAPTVTDDFDLPDYNQDLSQRLGDATWADPAPSAARARQYAATIASLLDVTSRQEAQAAMSWLEAFFLEHCWPATFRAIEIAALDGLDFRTLRVMAALREVWADRPEWWLRRTPTTPFNIGGTATTRLVRGDIALSWTLSRRLCLARQDFPPEDIIDPEWLAEWYVLPPMAPGALFFTAYLQEKVDGVLAAELHDGFTAKALEDEPVLPFHRLGVLPNLRDDRDGEMISLTMVDLTSRRQRKLDDDS